LFLNYPMAENRLRSDSRLGWFLFFRNIGHWQVMIALLRLAERKGCNTGKLIDVMLRQDKAKWVVDRLQIDPARKFLQCFGVARLGKKGKGGTACQTQTVTLADKRDEGYGLKLDVSKYKAEADARARAEASAALKEAQAEAAAARRAVAGAQTEQAAPLGLRSARQLVAQVWAQKILADAVDDTKVRGGAGRGGVFIVTNAGGVVLTGMYLRHAPTLVQKLRLATLFTPGQPARRHA
jgi:hypothetical protein